MYKKQAKEKMNNDLYYESSKSGINQDDLTHQKILNDYSGLTDWYLNESMKKFKEGKSIEEIEKFLQESPVKGISWWILKKIKES
jgi:hypothetical protein